MAVTSTPKKRRQNVNVPGTLDTQGVASFQDVVNLAQDPDNPLEAATKQYVDAIQTGLDFKDSITLATTESETDIDLTAAPETIDGVTISLEDRILVKDQNTTPTENGIYTVDSENDDGTYGLVRSEDADNSPEGEVTSGMFAFVEQGDANAEVGYVLATDEDPIDLGTTELEFVKFTKAVEILAGQGLEKDNNTLNIPDNAITDALIGSRTLDDTAEATDEGQLTSLINGIVNVIKTLKGTSDWKTGVDVTLDTPEAPADVTPVENSDTVEVTVGLPSTRTNVNKYELWRSVGDNNNYELVTIVEDEEISDSDTEVMLVDEGVEELATVYYKAYAVNNGIRSESTTANLSLSNTVGEVTNFQVTANQDYYDLRYDLPQDKKLKEIYIKVDQDENEDNISEGNATEIYRGNSDNLIYEIPSGDEEKAHKFWVYTVTRGE